MVIKPKIKSLPVKKPVKPKTVVKKPVINSVSSNTNDLQKIIDVHTKQIQKLDQMYIAIQKDIKDIKSLVSQKENQSFPPVATNVKPTPVKTKVPVKAATKTVSKATSVKVPVKKQTIVSDKVPKTIKKTATTTKKVINKVNSDSFSTNLIEIPKEISDRINNLTLKKKVTQTQLGKEIELSQKAIHEIATKKMKDIHKDTLSRLVAVLKKYEAK